MVAKLTNYHRWFAFYRNLIVLMICNFYPDKERVKCVIFFMMGWVMVFGWRR